MLFIPEKFRIIKVEEIIDNDVWNLFMTIGGNKKLINYMEKHKISKIRLQDDLIM